MIAIGVVVEIGGGITENASWLRKPEDCDHINVAELEVVLKSLSLTSDWRLIKSGTMGASSIVHKRIKPVISENFPVRTQGISEMLFQRRLALLQDKVREYNSNV